MIDLHNHMLPGIDDGAPDLPTALALARQAVANGITHVVCTAHIHPGRYDNTPATIGGAFTQLKTAIAAEGIPLRIAAAAEMRFGLELMQAANDRQIPFLGQWQGKKVILLEFPHGELPFGAEKLTAWLLAHKVVPMIAHPERNKAILRTPSKLKPFLAQGCLIQLTAGSVAGRFGEPCQALSQNLLSHGVVTVLATDAHNETHRPPDLAEGMRHAAAIVGDVQAECLVRHTPWQIAQSRFQ